jgi:tetratricopeptide (TPR) repeat protein
MSSLGRDIAFFVGILAKNRALLVGAAGASLSGAALTGLPLFGVPGWELGTAMALALTVVGGAAGVVASRLRLPGPALGPAARTSRGLVGCQFAAASLLALLVLVLPVVVAIGRTLAATPCDPFAAIGLFALLAIPSALLACGAGLWAGHAVSRAWRAGLLYAGVVAASLIASLWPLWAGPQVFALNHFLGYFPGPLYDEALYVDGRLLAYRALTLLWTGLSLLGATHALERREKALVRRKGLGRLAAWILLLGAIGLFFVLGPSLGLITRTRDLERALGGRVETAHLVLHFQAAKPIEEVRRLERDLELRFEQVARFLGSASSEKIQVWLYESPASKRLLVGASETSFSKPWRHEIHIQDEPFPHPVARHELAHAMAAFFGSAPFRVSARDGVLVNMGIVEGLAVASDNRTDELTLHQWAAAMRRLHLAPDIREIVGPVGFWRQAPARAYTLAGSFLRFLQNRYGSAALRSLYPTGDFQQAFDLELHALATEWETFLDGVRLDERALHAAQIRFERSSLFERPCARESAVVCARAEQRSRVDPQAAVSLWRRCQAVEPNSLDALQGEAGLLAARGRAGEARQLWESVLAKPQLTEAERARALMALGDLAWTGGARNEARQRFQAALSLHRDRATDRMAAIKLEALRDDHAEAALRRYFERPIPDLPEILGLEELSLAEPQNPVAPYLIGRQLLQRGAPAEAARYLERARSLGFLDRQVSLECLRLLAKAHYLAGDCPAAVGVLGELARAGDEVDRAFASDWDERCAFEERVWGGPLKSER